MQFYKLLWLYKCVYFVFKTISTKNIVYADIWFLTFLKQETSKNTHKHTHCECFGIKQKKKKKIYNKKYIKKSANFNMQRSFCC